MEKAKNTWQENMKIFESTLSMFKDGSNEASKMRRHIMHWSEEYEENPSFDEFVFLTVGPLENGVYYDIVTEKLISNKARDIGKQTMMKALTMILSFPEFSLWHAEKCKPPKVTPKFAGVVLGQNFMNKTAQPKGYLLRNSSAR